MYWMCVDDFDGWVVFNLLAMDSLYDYIVLFLLLPFLLYDICVWSNQNEPVTVEWGFAFKEFQTMALSIEVQSFFSYMLRLELW